MPDTPDEQPPGRPVGSAIRWIPEELFRLSQITTEDEVEAHDLWREYAGGGMRTLLDAKRDAAR